MEERSRQSIGPLRHNYPIHWSALGLETSIHPAGPWLLGWPHLARRVNDLPKVSSYLLSGPEENAQEPSLFDCLVPEFAPGTSLEGYVLSLENPALGLVVTFLSSVK